MFRQLRIFLLFFLAQLSLPFSTLAQAEEKTSDPIYIESLGSLKSNLFLRSPSEVLKKYLEQMPYSVDNPQQEFLHNMNLGALSLMAHRPVEARNYLLKAAKHIHWQNYTSILEEVGKVIIAEDAWNRQPLQPQEYLIYHYLFSLTYLQENKWKEALVSVRAMEKVLQDIALKYADNPLKEHAFFYWYSGFVYEKNGFYDDARIDYELTQQVASKWPRIQNDIWRVSALAGDEERETNYAKKILLDGTAKLERLRMAKEAKPRFAFIHMHKKIRWLNQDQRTMLSQAAQLKSIADSELYLGFSRLDIDQEFEKKTQGTFPNPAYLIHVNPISAVLLSIKELVKGVFSDSDRFKINSVAFLPEAIFIVPLQGDLIDITAQKTAILNLQHLYVLQSTDGHYLVPFE